MIEEEFPDAVCSSTLSADDFKLAADSPKSLQAIPNTILKVVLAAERCL